MDILLTRQGKNWRVQLINNEVKCVKKFEFDTTSGEYLFVIDIENDMYITKYWPVRFKAQNSGQFSCILTRLVFDNNDKIQCNE